MEKKSLKLNDINTYKIAFNLSNYVWDIVVEWEWFAKKHIKGQFVEAMDSVSANIEKGFGRYHKKDKIRFYRYGQGSIKECLDWNEKSKVRKLLPDEQYQDTFKELQKLARETSHFIQFTNKKLTM